MHAGNIIPSRFVLKLLPPSFQQEVIVNWLDVEVPQQAHLHGLEELNHWRNREVHAFIQAFDWTAAMFSVPVSHEYEWPSQRFIYLHQPRRHVPVVPRVKNVA